MTDNEKLARKLLDIGFQFNAVGEFISEIEKIIKDMPVLTDIECANIAVNYPITIHGVRSLFPSVNKDIAIPGENHPSS